MKVAIAQFGEVADLQFPNIPPEINAEGVHDIAIHHLMQMLETHKNAIAKNEFAVLLNGEQSFIILFYLHAQQHNIPCYVATSERNSVILSDGSKKIQFDFVQFRKI